MVVGSMLFVPFKTFAHLEVGVPPNNALQLTKPAQAMELRS
jgi:hypothetical protein